MGDAAPKIYEASGACVHLFHLHDTTEFPCAVHLQVDGSSVYIVLEGWPAVTRSPYSDLLSSPEQDQGKTEKEVRQKPHFQTETEALINLFFNLI